MKLFVGKRQAGKTHLAIRELLEKVKKGDTVGVVGRNLDTARQLKKTIEKMIPEGFITIKPIKIEDIHSMKLDFIFIDDLDMVLPDNCICTSGNAYNVKRTPNVDIPEGKYISYEEIDNVIESDKYVDIYIEKNDGKLELVNSKELIKIPNCILEKTHVVEELLGDLILKLKDMCK